MMKTVSARAALTIAGRELENLHMKNGLPSKLTKGEMDEFSAILGSAPVLSSESERNYNALWENLIVSCVPRDCMEVLLIRQVQNETWKIMRYTRHQAIGIDRRFRQSLEFQAQRRKEQAAQSEVLAREAAEKAGRPVTELGKMAQLKVVVMSSAEDVDDILQQRRGFVRTSEDLRQSSGLGRSMTVVAPTSLARVNG